MPYIPKEERKKYDGLIDCFANIIDADVYNSNELFQVLIRIFRRLAMSLCDPKLGGKKCYSRMAVILSALNESNHEFRRRMFCSSTKLEYSMSLLPTNQRRPVHGQLVASLAAILNRLPDNDTLSGELNYVLFCLAKLLCRGKPISITDVVSCAMLYAQDDFRRKVLVPYEDKKIELTGDIE